MLFQTFGFLVFLVASLVAFWLAPGRARLAILAAANALFYLAAGWQNLALFLAASLLTYRLGAHVDGPRGRGWMWLGIGLNLLNLAWFKYAGFFAGGWIVAPGLLPIGISFYTFQHISYLADRRQRGLPAAPNYLHFWVYISFFGHSIAGPIMRGHELFPQLVGVPTARFDSGRLLMGLAYFAVGLVKKVAVATPLAGLADPLFARASTLSPAEAWAAALLFAFQIYFDFSAYSDMAVGIGHMVGLTLPQNFRTPYVAADPSDFWRRWHATLSAWIRDYVYIPLGGNRAGAARRQLNLALAMLASGLWHGANWTFVCWGAFHAALLLGHRGLGALGWRPPPGKAYRACAALGFFLLTTVGWVFFRAADLPDAAAMLQAMVDLPHMAPTPAVAWLWALAAGLWALHWLEAWLRADEALTARRLVAWIPLPVQALAVASLAILFLLGCDGAEDFIYFRF